MADMTYVSGAIGLVEWGIGDEVKKLIMQLISETIEDELRDDPPRLSFPYMWAPESDGHGGPAVTDPATIEVEFPLGGSETERVAFRTSLELVVDDFIEAYSAYDGLRKSGWERCHVLAERLRELANKLDNAPRSKHWDEPEWSET